jgi:tetratricopeptide (TPR) repeat protein
MAKRIKLPHIHRKFSASFSHWFTSGLFLSILMLLFIINIQLSSYRLQPAWKLKIQTLQSSCNLCHLQLAYQYWHQGLISIAYHELNLINNWNSLKKSSVLGISTENELISAWQKHPQTLKNNYQYWLGVTQEKPDYQAGYLMLGVSAYQLGKINLAKTAFQSAQNLDPNDPQIQYYLGLINK